MSPNSGPLSRATKRSTRVTSAFMSLPTQTVLNSGDLYPDPQGLRVPFCCLGIVSFQQTSPSPVSGVAAQCVLTFFLCFPGRSWC